ncbi:MFS transporter [Demequina sp. NBRC 110051]|uniref:MFS transporter n=1 Tax=Demequina sp. NBRC 110051 TaxID=1570340 RepID=UPI000A036E15|nr:MFS transporter [Demequina sp. NBRC 110051]
MNSSLLRQPKAVWAVAFASVVAFMGIGLVDPILPAISESLEASPTEAEMLFTSYLVVTGIAMFFTSWVSGRIGARRTLLLGLTLVVIFAALAGAAGNVDQIIGLRAGWGLGNALFISTALATIIGAAAGGAESAIILYEAALGLGIAIGPLLGGLLGSVSWRGPFFGTAALMAVAFITIAVLLRSDPTPRVRVPLSAPFKALARPQILLLAVTALLYNIGFFTLLAYTPFPLGFSAMGLGWTFFGWGIALAVTSVWVAPALTHRFPRTAVLPVVLSLLALDLVACAFAVTSPAALVVGVVAGGALLGVLNTVFTESVMEATDLPRSVASSSYSGVRFLGGAAAPPLATVLADQFTAWTPYVVAAISVALGAALVWTGRGLLARASTAHEDVAEEAQAITAGEVA